MAEAVVLPPFSALMVGRSKHRVRWYYSLMSEIRVGISGWTYEPWRGEFYPDRLPHKRELEYASRKLNSIEINGTFYSLQKPETFRKWHSETPDDFIFAVKGSKYISHRKRLKDIRIPLANFFASGLLLLGDKLGPILWQFPKWEKFEKERFSDFMELLPKTTAEAAELASENTIKKKENAWIEAISDQELRYAFEPRNDSFFTKEFINLLRKQKMALVFADSAGKYGYSEDITSDLIYIRLHGKDKLYESDYSDEELDGWAKRIKTWSEGGEPSDAIKIVDRSASRKRRREVFAYFDNSIKVHAPFDAMKLSERLGILGINPT
jgi:uncharacterized protein YecE (DUF72 family)